MRNIRASGIIILLGIISFLGLFLITIYSFSQVGQDDGSGYLDRFRARLLAQAGVERTIKELKNYSAQQWSDYPNADWVYRGEDSDNDGKLQVIEDRNDNNYLDTLECPLESALYPSFAVKDEVIVPRSASGEPNRDEKNLPVLKKINGQKTGYSGRVSVPSSSVEGLYAIKVIDANSRIYINGTDDGIIRLLDNLGNITGAGDGLGQRIFQLRETRPHKKFQVKEELESLLGKETYQKIKHYLTLQSHPNEKVIKPKKLAERGQALQLGINIQTLFQLNTGMLDLESRTPVNINTAPKTVLMAVLTNLEGFYLNQTGLPASMDEGVIGRLESARITAEMAEQVAERIIQTRLKTSFLEWPQFNKFCDELMREGVFGPLDNPVQRESAQARADVIKANANPNTIFNEFNPDRSVYQLVDKSDLTAYTTEFCFLPTGFFEIESLGLLVTSNSLFGKTGLEAAEFNLLAGYKVRAVVDLFQSRHETHQEDFRNGQISSAAPPDLTRQNKTLQIYPAFSGKGRDGQIYLATVSDNPALSEKERENRPSDDKHTTGAITFWFKPGFSFDSDKPVLILKSGGEKNNSGENNAAPVFELWAYPDKYQDTADFGLRLRESPAGKLVWFWGVDGGPQQETVEYVISQPLNHLNRHNWAHIGLAWDSGLSSSIHSCFYCNGLGKAPPAQIPSGEGETQPSLIPLLPAGREATKGEITLLCPRCNGTGRVKITGPGPLIFCLNGQNAFSKCLNQSLPSPETTVLFKADDLLKVTGTDIIKNGNFTVDGFSLKTHENLEEAKEFIIGEYQKGRYYKGEGSFHSGLIAGPSDFTALSPHVSGGQPGIKTFVSWTVYYPEDLINSLSPLRKGERWAFSSGAVPKVTIQFFNRTGEPLSAALDNPAGSEFNLPVSPEVKEPVHLRYKVFFDGNEKNFNTPLLESPVFDDLTITFVRPEAKILEWYVLPYEKP